MTNIACVKCGKDSLYNHFTKKDGKYYCHDCYKKEIKKKKE